MPPKKRRRAASTLEDGNAAPSVSAATTKPVSLAGFALLPAELKQHVIDLACLAPSSSSSSLPSKRSVFTSDTATALALCLASKELNALATSSLYRAIIITRPSALYYLYRTLKARPERAKLTRRLHLGPLDALPANWWPLDNAFPEGEGWSAKDNRYFGLPYTWVRSTLSQSELPCGYEPGHAWALGRTLPGCREAAISDALQAAQDYLDVNIKREASQASTTKVVGILEVQAALDSYLDGIRDSERYDDKLIKLAQPGARVPLGCRNGNCKHYMAFSIMGTGHRRHSYRRTWPLGGVHQTSRLVILRHLARPGSTTDRFDHPLLLARSGFDVSVTTGLGKGHKEHIPGRRTFYVVRSETWDLSDVHEKHEWPDLAALKKDQHQWKQGYKWGDESDEDKEWCRGMVTRNKILINTGTLGQTLRLARSVYGLLPNLEDVSLTGIFEAIFDYTQGVEQLRRLSFGPSPPFWDTQLALSGFEQLERLHICGIAVTEEELLCITNEMPQLKEFQWSMFEEITSIYELSLLGTIELLLKREAKWIPTDVASQQDDQQAVASVDGAQHGDFSQTANHQPRPITSEGTAPAPTADSAEQQQQQQPQLRWSLPNDAFIIVKLHPSDVLEVMAAAPSFEVSEAWREGRRSVEGQRRLLLQDNAAALHGPARLWLEGGARDWDKVYAGGRGWWHEKGA